MGYIYKIYNDVNKNLYIGQTTISVSARWSQHKQNAKEREGHLYLAMRKYGIENFHIEQIEEVSNDLLDEREIYWIQYYNTYYDGYNSTLGGNGRKSPVLLQEIEGLWQQGYGISEIAEILGVSRMIIRDRIYTSPLYSEEEAQSRGRNKMLSQKRKGIIQKTLDGEFIAYYESGVQAEEKTGINRKTISQALRRTGRSSGYIWEYADISKRNQSSWRKVQQFTKQGELIATFNSVGAAAEKNNIKASGIYATCNGQQKTSGGYVWKYIDG